MIYILNEFRVFYQLMENNYENTKIIREMRNLALINEDEQLIKETD